MDNKAYLDQIAVKSEKQPSVVKSLITPDIIKLLLAGIIALVLIFAIIGILSANNKKTTQKFEALYLRATNLVSDNSPLIAYNEKLKSLDLRQYNNTLFTTLDSFNVSYNALISTVDVNPEKISQKVHDAENINTAEMEGNLENGYLNGYLDRAYATTAYAQTSNLIYLSQTALSASTNEDLSGTIDTLIRNLTTLQNNYKTYIDTH